MKLPDELMKNVKYFSVDDIDVWESIVRDCVKICIKVEDEYGYAPGAGYAAAEEILDRYGLEGKCK